MTQHPAEGPNPLLVASPAQTQGVAVAARPRYLDIWLGPLHPLLQRSDVTDIYVNRPGECWVETMGGACERLAVPMLDAGWLNHLARQIAGINSQGISRAQPLLSAMLPGGERVQIVGPPATRDGMALAIRKHVVGSMTLDQYLANGALNATRVAHGAGSVRLSPAPPDEGPEALRKWLTDLVQSRANILISGGTSSGKTTFLNALLREVSQKERLIFIEDVPELDIQTENAVGLIAVKGELGEANVTAQDLLEAALRMRPDRIIVGELRGSEAYAYLRAVNTGHPGSMTTIHADSTEGALQQLALIVMQSGTQLSRADVIDYATQVIDVIIQLDRTNGERRIAKIMRTRA